MAGEKIAVVDDDPGVREALTDYLTNHGYNVDAAASGAALDELMRTASFDLILLDVMMPGENGLDLCQRLATQGMKIIMISALDQSVDRVAGLEIGAADYLGKPFQPRELLARIRAVLRRSAQPGQRLVSYTFAGWRYDPEAQQLRDEEGQAVELTGGEMELLKAFLDRPNRVLSRDSLLMAARGHQSEAYDRAIDLAVSRLRRKLGDVDHRLIQTVRGLGYRFAAQVTRR